MAVSCYVGLPRPAYEVDGAFDIDMCLCCLREAEVQLILICHF